MAKKKHKVRMRLTDIDTREVSAVDKAANQRVWVLRKDAGEMARKKVVPDGKGGMKIEEAVETPAPAPESTAKAAVSKATKETLLAVAAQLTALADGPEAEADSEELGTELTKALEAFETEESDELQTLAKAAEGKDVEAIQKSLTGCATRLNEIAASLGIEVEDPGAIWHTSSRIGAVLEALRCLSYLEQDAPAAAAQVAAAVGVTKSAEETDKPSPESALRYKKLVHGLQKALYSNVHSSEDPSVTLSDIAKTATLLEDAHKLIKQLQARNAELESRPQPSNKLSVEGQPTRTAKDNWPSDLAAGV